MNVLSETREYLTKLKINGENILTHSRKTPALGIIIDTYSFANLATDLFGENILEYLLPYKCSQDHIEMFFSCVRARGGSNDNPNALQFKYIMRKLLFRNSIRPSIYANWTTPEYEISQILEFRSAERSTVEEKTEEADENDQYEVLINLMAKTDLSEFKNNIITHAKSLTLNNIGQRATLRQRLRKTILFSNV